MQKREQKKPGINSGINLGLGKIPPQDIIAEKAVLGALMLEKSKQQEVMGIIPKSECFYLDHHSKIYEAIIELDRLGSNIDLITITSHLTKKNELEIVGGAHALTMLTMSVTSSAHVESHARLVMEKYMQRESIRISGELIGMAYENEDCFEIIDYAERSFMGLTMSSVSKGFVTASKLAKEAMENLDRLMKNTGELTGIATGYDLLNKSTHGWQNTDLVIIGARPSIGKTAFALNLALNAMVHGIGVGIFSLEMSSLKLTNRVISMMSGIDMGKIKRGVTMTDSDIQLYNETCVRFSRFKCLIDDDANLNITQVKSKARRMVTKEGVQLIIIDYLQLMSGTGDRRQNREQEISTISRNLKILAKELEVPIIALSQLNRSMEGRADKTPNLSDLRESGAIEQDADVICFLYGPRQNEKSEQGGDIDEERVTRYLDIAKNREGSLATIDLIFNTTTQKFYDQESLSRTEAWSSNPRAGFPSHQYQSKNTPDF